MKKQILDLIDEACREVFKNIDSRIPDKASYKIGVIDLKTHLVRLVDELKN